MNALAVDNRRLAEQVRKLSQELETSKAHMSLQASQEAYQDCPGRAATVSASSPDPRTVKAALLASGQIDVQHSLPGR